MQDWWALEKLWQKHCDPAHQEVVHDIKLWHQQLKALYANHLAYPAVIKFLLEVRPNLPEFKDWLQQMRDAYQILESAEQAADADADDNLTQEQIDFWHKNGYLVLSNAIDAKACAASRDAIWRFLNADINDPTSWYRAQHLQQGLMLPFYNHPQLNTNRASKRIRTAFEQLYGTKAIYKTIDQTSFNPPETNNFSFRGNGLHWDVSLTLPIPERYQGLLYLSDCDEMDGAFHCVPGFHHQITPWLEQLAPHEDPRECALRDLQAKAVTGKAGDFIIWHQALPHCATANRGKTPRMVQYLAYIPDDHVDQSVWR